MSDRNAGTLYLCATPIGNLSDISERVLETLRSVDVIAAEDTRNSIKLLNHFDIKKPLTSYHEYNRYDKANELIDMMRQGADVAVITDAGTPAISDPGQVLADMCHAAGITVTALPGPCALITALAMSGIDSRRFVFEGFLPPDKKERRQILGMLEDEMRTVVVYEAPHHLLATLEQLYEHLGDRNIAVCRELTKKFEEVKRMRLCEAIGFYKANEPRGEFVLVIEGRSSEELMKEKEDKFRAMDLEEHMSMYESQGMDHKEAMKMVAADRGVSKRDIYNQLIIESNGRSN
ncbi:MAG: 16S rRNA (cytidine(1402)-2'-O)-methyltransferase [Lachnospiraceae bacterium]|nr:16S rRNA (cytidine(1402)-2'-O)-methyltransferase [Lachnospiraceae bacterium]